MQDPSGRPREQHSTLSLTNLLKSLGVDIQCAMHNSGNDAVMLLLALQLLLDPSNTRVPLPKGANGRMPMNRSPSWSPAGVPSIAFMPTPPMAHQLGIMPPQSPSFSSRRSPDEYFERETGANYRGLGFLSLNDSSRRGSPMLSQHEGGSRSRVSSSGSAHDLVNRMAGLAVKHDPYTP